MSQLKVFWMIKMNSYLPAQRKLLVLRRKIEWPIYATALYFVPDDRSFVKIVAMILANAMQAEAPFDRFMGSGVISMLCMPLTPRQYYHPTLETPNSALEARHLSLGFEKETKGHFRGVLSSN
jgi:hypothetical protein